MVNLLNEYAAKEDKATKKFFADLNKKVKALHPSHRMWTEKGINSYRFTDFTVTTLNGSIVAIIPSK